MRGFFISGIISLMKRFLKQFLYGTFYLLIIGGIVWGVYLIEFKPAPTCFDNLQNGGETEVDCGGSCVSCEIKNLKPLALSDTVLFGSDRFFSANAKVSNLNKDFGIRKFDYKVNFYEASGKVIHTVQNSSFIYSEETKNLIEAGARITTAIPVKAEFILEGENINWEKASDFSSPPVLLRDVSAVVDSEQVIISGNITNTNNFTISKIVASAFLVDKLGKKTGVSKTELKDTGPFRVENFKIFVPLKKALSDSADLDATAKSVVVEVLK